VLNASAAHIWLARAQDIAPNQIKREIVEATGASADQVATDMWDVFASLRESGLFDASGAQPGPNAPPVPAPHIEWNIGAIYELAGIRVAVQAPTWDVMHLVHGALGLRSASAGAVHHRLEISSRGALFALAADSELEGPLVPREVLGVSCRRRLRAWATNEVVGVAFDGAALCLPEGDCVVITGTPALRSELVDAWCGSGFRIVADEFVWIVNQEVAALHVGREMPIGEHVHPVVSGRTEIPPLDDCFAPVRYLPVPPAVRATAAARVRAVLSLIDSQPESTHTPTIEPMQPEDALTAMLGARAAAGLSEEAAGQLVCVLSTVPAYELAVPAPLLLGTVDAIVDELTAPR
jgi:hypothetical protein